MLLDRESIWGQKSSAIGLENDMTMEGKNIEFKRELADSIEKDVVSFLNTLGGEIYSALITTAQSSGLMILMPSSLP